MPCCSPTAADRHFGADRARADLEAYHRNGPGGTTRRLLALMRACDVRGRTLLDVGGGVGVIAFELCAAGVWEAVLVDLASAFVTAAEGEATRRGLRHRVRCIHGDAADPLIGLPEADIVTLDRVVCCYDAVDALVDRTAAKCRHWYALSYPADRWYVRLVVRLENARRRRRGDPLRSYVHAEARMHRRLVASGLRRVALRDGWRWRVALYERTRAGDPAGGNGVAEPRRTRARAAIP